MSAIAEVAGASSTGSPSPSTSVASKNRIVLSQGCIVCDSVVFRGAFKVTIGPGCVLQPQCVIDASAGDIILGADNVLEERCVIRNASLSDLKVGSMNVFEVGCIVEAASVGDCNFFGSKSHVHQGSAVGDRCMVGVGTSLPKNYNLQSGSVAYRLGENDLVTRYQPSAADLYCKEARMYLNSLRNPMSRNCLLNFHQLLMVEGSGPVP